MSEHPSRRRIPRLLRELWWIVVLAVVLTTFAGVALFPSWIVVMVVWFVLSGYCVAKTPKATSRGLIGAQRAAIFGFPVAASAWKLHEFALLGQERNVVANRIQHGGWAACMAFVCAPVIWSCRSSLSGAARAVWLCGVVTVLGNLGELMEYPSHRASMVADVSTARPLLTDTVADLVMNLVGVLVAVAAVSLLTRGAPGTASLRDTRWHSDQRETAPPP